MNIKISPVLLNLSYVALSALATFVVQNLASLHLDPNIQTIIVSVLSLFIKFLNEKTLPNNQTQIGKVWKSIKKWPIDFIGGDNPTKISSHHAILKFVWLLKFTNSSSLIWSYRGSNIANITKSLYTSPNSSINVSFICLTSFGAIREMIMSLLLG